MSANPKASVAITERSMWHLLGSHLAYGGLFLCPFITNNNKKKTIIDIYEVSVTESQALTRVTSFNPLNRPQRVGQFLSQFAEKTEVKW